MRRDFQGDAVQFEGLRRTRGRIYSTDGTNWYDLAVFAGVLLLVTVTPLVMGAVHPWAFIAAEIVILAMLGVWMAKLAFAPPIAFQPTFGRVFGLALPLGLFLALVAFQLVPLAPQVLGAISPATYHLYVRTLDGWPTHPAGRSGVDRGDDRDGVSGILRFQSAESRKRDPADTADGSCFQADRHAAAISSDYAAFQNKAAASGGLSHAAEELA